MLVSTYRIGVLGGDGIGPEVVAEGLKAIGAAGVGVERVDYDLGAARWLRDGTVLPESVLEEWRSLDAIYVGAVGTPEVTPGLLERGLLLRMRFELDLYVNLRPFRLPSRGIHMDVVRENTEGTYVGEGGILRKGTPHEIATQGSVNTRMGVERCVRFAFELAASRSVSNAASGAASRGRPAVTLVHKTNIMPFAGDLWQRTFDEVAEEFPDVTTDYNHVDAACIYFVNSPEQYDVIVTDNLFGDILTDLGGAVSGGIGKAASANLNPARTGPSMFEPVHGSAPGIAGKGVADPTAAVLSAAMMLDFLGEASAAAAIEEACASVSEEVTGTTAIGDAIAAAIVS